MTNRPLRFAAAGAAATAFSLTAPAAASAHGIVGRADLPIPGWLFAWAAAAVLAISFFAFAVLWQEPKLEVAEPHPRFTIPRFLDPLCGALGLAIMAFLVYAGFAGTQIETSNILPTFIYVFFWSLLPLLSALFGDLFRAFNPWRAVGRFGGWITGKLAGEQLPAPFEYPAKLGRLPAVFFLFCFGFIELVTLSGRQPDFLALAIVGYFFVQLVGMTLFGVDRWLERGDAFNVYFNVFSRMSALTVVKGKLATRLPLSGLTDITWLPATVLFFCASIGITAFDGSSEGSVWQSLSSTLQSQFEAIGFSTQTALQIAFTIGLLLSIGIVFGFYRLGIEGMVSSHIDMSAKELARTFAPSLVPIMLGYILAHYFSFIMFQGQTIWVLVSDPLGHGANYFGTAGGSINYRFLSTNAIWYFQVVILIVGHVLGLAVAHDKALAVWGKARAAVQSQIWMLVVMVGFTSLGLWLLSQANR
ncbi:MAG: fenitrothion hydrolase [Solirubrobacterales bacterium]